MPPRIGTWLIGLIFLASFTGCGASSARGPLDQKVAKASRYPIPVVCTTSQVGDAITNIGGEHVKVVTLMGPSVDPHQYSATLGDAQKIDAADIVFYNGLHLEGRMTDMLENLAQRKPCYALAKPLIEKMPKRLRTPPEFEGGYDPHIWFDVSLWSECVKVAIERLSEFDPGHKADYEQRGAAYLQQLAELDEVCRTKVAEIPAEQRVLVTAHDAFGYFGARYGVEVHGLQGISTVDEADLEKVNHLVDLIVSRKVKAVFVESSVPEKNILGLIERCERKGHKLVKGPSLYSDAMGPAGSPEEHYVEMIRYNVNAIVGALK